jgi:Outer membrane protein beta-barrel domain
MNVRMNCFVWMGATLLWFGVFAQSAMAEQNEARVHDLEERVHRLEDLVKMLVEAERSAGTISTERAQVVLADLDASSHETFVTESALAVSDPALPAAEMRTMPQELLPNLGKIGGEVSFRVGANSGPFSLNTGNFFGGAIELPLALAPGGRLNYEISLGLAQADRRLPVTSNVAQISNLAVLTALNPNNGAGNIQQALSGTGAAPFPVTSNADWRAQVLQLVPFALKYNSTLLDRYRMRPYAVVGLGTYVSVSNQAVSSGLAAGSTLGAGTLQTLTGLLGTSPFGGSLIGGQIAPSSQLNARHLPAGQGGIDIGVHYGTGLEYRLSNGLSLALDARFNKVPDGVSYHTATATWGWHF